MATDQPGVILRAAREAAGLSLGAMARRTNYSKPYLSRVEAGQRRLTPEIVAAYEQALGDDMHRRHLLTGLLAGLVAPSTTTEAVAHAFETALDQPRLTRDDWLGRLESYGADYMTTGASDLQARLAADLVRIRPLVDDPELCATAARMLTVHGKTIPSDDASLRWYRLAVRTADRSGDNATRVWVRGRAALALAYEGAALDDARMFASDALGLDDRPSLGRINAQLGLAHAHGLRGDRTGALDAWDDARRTFDLVGSDDQISDFAIPEWRMATISSLLLARLGEERLAVQAQDTADQTRPASLSRFATHIELHRGLMIAKAGDPTTGITNARAALARLPEHKHSLSLRMMLTEIEATGTPPP